MLGAAPVFCLGVFFQMAIFPFYYVQWRYLTSISPAKMRKMLGRYLKVSKDTSRSRMDVDDVDAEDQPENKPMMLGRLSIVAIWI